ncbi:MAG: sugar phosphate isomerase/epimerase [Thaumarchaeota archaeon]|nr:sugar phosphate isomerase/epimerase [Nitrososphaerota archaeon]
MKLGVFNPVFYHKSFDDALDEIKGLGLEAVEIACGNYTGNTHCNPKLLLSDSNALSAFKKKIDDRGLEISALSCHGNPLHPSPTISEAHRQVQHETIQLADKLGVDRIITFSGCPGDSESSKYPNWVTSAWPDDYPKVLEWQWKEKVIPYWREEVEFAEKNGIYKICIEPHPGFVVYNPETMLKLRHSCGKVIGVNYDPSHMFWQHIDPSVAITKLAESIFHFHAKDTFLNLQNIIVNGVLDGKSYREMKDRSWYFRSVGYGHDQIVWKDMMSALRLVGYDYVVSIEHEDMLLSREEGLKKAVEFLKPIMVREPLPEAWWT